MTTQSLPVIPQHYPGPSAAILLRALLAPPDEDGVDEWEQQVDELCERITHWDVQEAIDVAQSMEQVLAGVKRWLRAHLAMRIGEKHQLRLGTSLYRYGYKPDYKPRNGTGVNATILDIIAADGRLGQWFNPTDALSSRTKVKKLAEALPEGFDLLITDSEGRPVTENGLPCVDDDGAWIDDREQGMYADTLEWVLANLVETVWPEKPSLNTYTQGQKGWPKYADDLPDGTVVDMDWRP